MESLKELTQGYIDKCTEILETKNIDEAKKFQELIIGTYGAYISGIEQGLDNYAFYRDESPVDYIGDMEKLKAKLEIFVASGCKLTKGIKDTRNININNSNENSNTNTNTNAIDVKLKIENLFEESIKGIEENESLSQPEIEEILNKIKEIKTVYETGESKNKKWFKLKPIVEWVSTKGVSVATAILGLITALLKLST